MIDDIAIVLWSSWKFANTEDIRRKCNLIVDLSKFTSNKKILSEIVTLYYNQVGYKISLKYKRRLLKTFILVPF